MTADSADKRGLEGLMPVCEMTWTCCLRCGCLILVHDAGVCSECSEILCVGCMGSHGCEKWKPVAVVRFGAGTALTADSADKR